MRGGQRLAVHAHREQGLPAVHDRIGGHADGHVVDVAHDDLVRAGLDPRLAQQRGEQRALPAGVADVTAADGLRDAGQRHVVLGHRHPRQLVEGDRHRVVDHAVDAQLPGRGRDLRDGQGRVDPVELAVRRIERGQARDVQRVFGRQRLLLDDPGRRDLDRRRRGLRPREQRSGTACRSAFRRPTPAAAAVTAVPAAAATNLRLLMTVIGSSAVRRCKQVAAQRPAPTRGPATAAPSPPRRHRSPTG